jgi:hypothetical protein
MMGNQGSGEPAGLKGLLARRGALPIIGGLAAVLVIGVVIVLAAGGGGGSSAVAQPTSAPADSAGLAKTPVATIAPPPTPVATQGPVVVTKPTAGVPGQDSGDRLVIAKANVNAPISLKVVPASGGELASPNGSDDVVFYDFSAWPGIGGYPGAGGTAIFSGHVDWGGRDGTGCKNNTVPAPCTAVFWDLDKLAAGDTIEVRLKGVSYTYKVTGAVDMAADDTDTWNRVIASSSKEGITLITCGGDFNKTTHEYDKRHIVTGERV